MGEVIRNLDWSVLTNILISVIPALICITVHEMSHGLAALRLGDNTAKERGRLSPNPLKHIDPFGLLMMIIVGFGWAKPVPVDMRKFKNPKRGMALTALAGPTSNILLAFIMLLVYWITFGLLSNNSSSSFATIIQAVIFRTAYLSVALAIFNLIPIPPLDGSKVFFSLVSDQTYFKLMRYERYGMILLVAILMWSNYTGSNAFNSTIGNATYFLFQRLSRFAQFVVPGV